MINHFLMKLLSCLLSFFRFFGLHTGKGGLSYIGEHDSFSLRADCVNDMISVGRSYEASCTVSNCVFQRTQSFLGNGGVIFLGSDQTASISDTVFYNCSVSSTSNMFGETRFNGGAIYSFGGSFSFNKVCAFGCKAKGTGQFLYSFDSNTFSFQMVSVAKCSDGYEGMATLTIGQSSDFQSFHSNNISDNKATLSLIQIWNIVASNLMYCTFINNHPLYYVCILFIGGSTTLTSSNFIENSSPQGNAVVTVEDDGNRFIYHCVFVDNQNVLFFLDYGSLTVNHCYISHSGVSFSGSSINTVNNSNSLFGTYQISFYNTHVCDILSDESPKQTPVETLIETPIETLDISPIETPMMTLIESPIETPINSPNVSPIETLIETPVLTPDVSPIKTPMMTLIESPIETPMKSPNVTLRETPYLSPTFNPTIIASPDQTQIESVNQNNGLLVVIGSMGIIGALFGIVFLYSFYKFDSPSLSCDSNSIHNTKEENPV